MQTGTVGWDWSLLAIVYAQDHGLSGGSLREREGGGGVDADSYILDGLITIQLQFKA